MRAIERFPDGIIAIDTGYVKPRLAASHLIVRDGRAAFVDTGTTRSLPKLLAGLEENNIPLEYVDYVFITHVHLDHAGGAGALMQQLPDATLVAHPRAAPHLAIPTQLVEATNRVYGEKTFRKLYGEIIPVPESRIRVVQDGERLLLGGSPLDFLHTPGHAMHHYCIHDREANVMFTGDTFGVSYREFDTAKGPFIFPATTPTHFDPEQAHASIERLLALNTDAAYLTHYSRVENLSELAEDLHGDLVAFVEIAKRCAGREDRVDEMKRMMFAYLCARLDEHGFPDDGRREEWLEMDVDLNAKGLAAWLDRQG
ncbi:MAG: MBL fold metallo-hydrolase [Proteobacteria bacterium]|nr:MBL fold metallo-hydrolase [Pseudomonadota bacterium]